MNAEPLLPAPLIFSAVRKTRRRLSSYLLKLLLAGDCHDIIAHARFAYGDSNHCRPVVRATAFASQGPGGGTGTASHFTQVAMAILVYGASAIVVAAGLIGAARRR